MDETLRRWFLIGCLQDGARKAALLENNNLVSHYYSGAKTMYEVFQRGQKVSGKLHKSLNGMRKTKHQD